MRSPAISVCFALSLLLGATACGARPSSPRSPAGAVDFALDGLPQESQFVLAIDVPRLARTPVGARLIDGLGGLMAQVLEKNGLTGKCDVHAQDLGLLVMGFRNSESGQDAAGLLRGPLAIGKLEACVKTMLEAKHAGLVHESVAGHDAFHADYGSPSDNAWVAGLDGNVIAIGGNREWLERVVDPATPRARQNQPLAATARAIDASAPVWIALVFDDELRAAMVAGANDMLKSAPRTLRLSALVSEKVTVDAVASFDAPEHATQAAELASGLLAQARSSVTEGPFAHVLAGVTIAAKGTEVSVHIVLEQADLDAVAQAFGQSVKFN